MTSLFQRLAQRHQNTMHFATFGEDIEVLTSAGKRILTTAIIKITEQTETTDSGTGVIVRAEVAIPSFIDPSRLNNEMYEDDPNQIMQIKSTWRLTFRGQTFAIESLSPPVAGFIKLNVIALSRELTHPPGLGQR
ncbi:MAG: hypothetical protein KDB01_11435 [Planctomycetaceae bacterium]|nr:hypothetical protein [Planctomycetaceae bacterium]